MMKAVFLHQSFQTELTMTNDLPPRVADILASQHLMETTTVQPLVALSQLDTANPLKV
jgi:hypothetical protein